MAVMWVVFVKACATLQRVVNCDIMRSNQQDCLTETIIFCSELRRRG